MLQWTKRFCPKRYPTFELIEIIYMLYNTQDDQRQNKENKIPLRVSTPPFDVGFNGRNLNNVLNLCSALVLLLLFQRRLNYAEHGR